MDKTNSLLEIKKVNIDHLKLFVENITDNQWNKWDYRQKQRINNIDNVNLNTKAFPLIWSYPTNFQDKIETYIMNREYKFHSIIQPYSNFLEDFFGGICIRSFLTKLSPCKTIPSHIDVSDTLEKVHRCHLPITTNEKVIFGIGKNEYNLKEGILYEVNNIDYHYVYNNSSKNRIHLIIDILPYKYHCNILKLYKDP